ncbi:hypothetical protein LDG_7940 [Legionella drancourtii LLAP12]|uniref:Uncharacterized protein n=1 Tax=Legionella drancourtii LLAP12 TaxID=658187 RepID=G9ERM4_9GAMM|nr:hypothetical protein LDG_7940 [Legionella drancourtii LLAP12]
MLVSTILNMPSNTMANEPDNNPKKTPPTANMKVTAIESLSISCS